MVASGDAFLDCGDTGHAVGAGCGGFRTVCKQALPNQLSIQCCPPLYFPSYIK
jgi:hypothetical protein